jgi:hypothetical protein
MDVKDKEVMMLWMQQVMVRVDRWMDCRRWMDGVDVDWGVSRGTWCVDVVIQCASSVCD